MFSDGSKKKQKRAGEGGGGINSWSSAGGTKLK